MYEFYCRTCNRIVETEEVDLQEQYVEGDFEEFHLTCGSKLERSLAPVKKEDM